jgi:acyl carrier protein phosphodiesterase
MRARFAEAIGAAREGVQSVNYLAHLYLAGDEPDDLIGNLMGDFVRGPVESDSVDRVNAGILLHRRIDTYTDSHCLVLQSKRRIRHVLRRFSGILVDVYFDHFLARNWSRYSSVSLREYSRLVYGILEEHSDALPPRMHRSVEYMI